MVENERKKLKQPKTGEQSLKTNEERRAHAINVKLLQETGKLVSEPNGAIKTKRKRPMEKNVTRFQASVR